MNTKELASLLSRAAKQLEEQDTREVCLESLIFSKILVEDFPMSPENPVSIFKLQSEVWKIAEEKGWHEKEISFGDFIALCHAELSEALEIYRKKGDSGIAHVQPFETMEHSSGGKVDLKLVTSIPQGIPVELADVIMRILDYCETFGIPMYQVLEMKMNYNRTREHRHGGKVL